VIAGQTCGGSKAQGRTRQHGPPDTAKPPHKRGIRDRRRYRAADARPERGSSVLVTLDELPPGSMDCLGGSRAPRTRAGLCGDGAHDDHRVLFLALPGAFGRADRKSAGRQRGPFPRVSRCAFPALVTSAISPICPRGQANRASSFRSSSPAKTAPNPSTSHTATTAKRAPRSPAKYLLPLIPMSVVSRGIYRGPKTGQLLTRRPGSGPLRRFMSCCTRSRTSAANTRISPRERAGIRSSATPVSHRRPRGAPASSLGASSSGGQQQSRQARVDTGFFGHQRHAFEF
jgi:hypothetical protein